MLQALGTDSASSASIMFADPLDDDMPGDEPIVTTRRALGRLALVASEAGARFQREAISVEPMAWMLAPRDALGGAAPLDACLTLDGCLRALVVHRLSLGMDANQAVVDILREDCADEDRDNDRGDHCIMNNDLVVVGGARPGARTGGVSPSRDELSGTTNSREPSRLYTATVVWTDGSQVVHAFHASIASSPLNVAKRLVGRLGIMIAADAQVVEGFRRDGALAEAMLSPAMRDMLLLIAANPASPLAAGLDLNIEQRFLN